jgi:pyruvate dehydrogenase E1 component beta subunit
MAMDPDVYLIGLGVPAPPGVFGTTTGLREKYGPARVLDIPAAENGMTGMALGTAILGMRPILIHHRMDFAVLSMEPIVNQAAKWHYMYGGHSTAPLTIRMIIGRGWGQGPQHSQSLQAWFAHVPGLQVVMPTTASDAKGLLAAAVQGETPTIVLEHRWLYELRGEVAAELNSVEIGKAAVRRVGTDVTLVSASYMTIESLKAADILQRCGVSAEVVDLRTISPMDIDTILNSVLKTGRLVVADTGQVNFGIGAEVIAVVAENCSSSLLKSPCRVGLPFTPTPTTPALADHYYPTSHDMVVAVMRMLDLEPPSKEVFLPALPLDIPSADYTGPY